MIQQHAAVGLSQSANRVTSSPEGITRSVCFIGPPARKKAIQARNIPHSPADSAVACAPIHYRPT